MFVPQVLFFLWGVRGEGGALSLGIYVLGIVLINKQVYVLSIFYFTKNLRNAVVITRWFKYDRDDLCVNESQFVPVIFEPPCKYSERAVM